MIHSSWIWYRSGDGDGNSDALGQRASSLQTELISRRECCTGTSRAARAPKGSLHPSLISLPSLSVIDSMESSALPFGRSVFLALLVSFLCLLTLPRAAVACASPRLYSHRSATALAWLAPRLRHKNVASLSSARWSLLGRLPPASPLSPPSVTSVQFSNWLHQHTPPSRPRHLSITPIDRPGFKSQESPLDLASFSTTPLKQGESLLDLPLDSCFSDAMASEGVLDSLRDAPWEVRLASKLLHERAKGNGSNWAPYIQALPEFVFLPLFFSDLELNNIQDTSVQEDVHRLRRFIESSFQSLTSEEVAGSKFTEYAWAMAVVYSSACEIAVQSSVRHVLVPFVTSSFEQNSKVSAVYVDGNVRLKAIEDIPEYAFLAMAFDHSNSSDHFIFRGIIDNNQSTVLLFGGILDMVDWYVDTYGALNSNKYLTLRVAQDSNDAFTNQLKPSMAITEQSSDIMFYSEIDGVLNPRMLCILGSLFYAKEVLAREVGNETFYIAEMNNMIGTEWEEVVNAMANGFMQFSSLNCEVNKKMNVKYSNAVISALNATKERMDGLLSTSSTVEEDKAFLAAARWDGFGGVGLSESGCSTCRWQIEEMSFNDYLAVLYRLCRKNVLQRSISQLSCLDAEKRITVSSSINQSVHDPTNQFVIWMERNGFSISEKLAITHLKAGDGKLVRGVVVLKDIRRGETLCNLPLNMGLYDNETVVAGEVDSWDRAAARLLREKAKGNSSAWASYINVLPQNVTVPILLEDHELHEVQWWPVLRELVQVRKSIRESFSLLSADDLAGADFQQYRWAALMVHSRAFTLPVIADEHFAPYVMMPYMDMINHHYHYQADWISQPIWGGKLEIIARRDIKKDEELFASFGPRANDNLFLYYGFVLEGNPFDVAGIFNSYEDAVRWFLNTWTTSCKNLVNPGALASCKRLQWEQQWELVKDALENVSGRGPSLNREWWHLVNLWADLGYQYIPFQPGPTVYFSGVTDPSLIALFESVANNTFQLNQTLRFNESSSFPATGLSRNQSSSVHMGKFFTCMKSHIGELSTQPLASGHPCWNDFLKVTKAADDSSWALLVGKISAGLRCLEVLSLFPTTIEEDRVLISDSSSSRTCASGMSCSGKQTVSDQLQLTRQYRYLKKLMLQDVVNNLTS